MQVPTGIEVKCQEQRERGRNRTIARQILHVRTYA
jgi:protein subunit release factor A